MDEDDHDCDDGDDDDYGDVNDYDQDISLKVREAESAREDAARLELIVMEQREASQPPIDAFLVEVDEDDDDEDDDIFLSQELEAKLEASRLREEQLIAEVEAVRAVSTF